MPESTQSPARERHVIRKRAGQIQRAIYEVQRAVEGLSRTDAFIALNEVLSDKLAEARAADSFALAVAQRPAKLRSQQVLPATA